MKKLKNPSAAVLAKIAAVLYVVVAIRTFSDHRSVH